MKVRTLELLRGAAALAILLSAAACSDGTGPGEQRQVPGTLVPAATVQGTGTVGATAAVVPSVTVKDTKGRAMANVQVTFEVSAGGGSVARPAATTDANGTASAGAWTLGTAPGTNTVTARINGLAPVTFTAVAAPDQPSSITPDPTNLTSGGVGQVVSRPPAVVVKDRFGNPTPGVTVTFTAAPGSGTLTGVISPVTDANGVARAGTWTLGNTTGNQALVVTAGTASASITMTVRGMFNIDVRFVGAVPAAYQQVFFDAVERWQNVIVGELSDITINLPANSCGGAPAVNEVIDDILIYVDLKEIDGVGQILGQAGPCRIRNANSLPVFGWMQFDIADLERMLTQGTLNSVIQHEIGHVLGIGTLWSYVYLLQGAGLADPYFSGAGAMSNYTLAGGIIAAGNGVPVENTGGAGTRDSHWREATLRNELMTGWISGGTNPMSAITIASLADLGYLVNMQAADFFSVPTNTGYGLQQAGVELRERPMPPPTVVF